VMTGLGTFGSLLVFIDIADHAPKAPTMREMVSGKFCPLT